MFGALVDVVDCSLQTSHEGWMSAEVDGIGRLELLDREVERETCVLTDNTRVKEVTSCVVDSRPLLVDNIL